MTYAENIILFNQSLNIKKQLPTGVEVLNPFQHEETAAISSAFYEKYYSDNKPQTIILGINPGRFGGGLTGVPFTDPIRLESICHIPNLLPKKAELSSEFIYEVIKACGGAEHFYALFYFSSISPLGFVKDGKNLNYYDQRELQNALNDFILQSLNTQLSWGIHRDKAYCLGEGQNFKFLSELNQQNKFFKEIIPLPHPRFVMQYKRKQLAAYIDLYCQKLIS